MLCVSFSLNPFNISLFLPLNLTKSMTRMNANWLCFSTWRRVGCGSPRYFERKAEIVAAAYSHFSVEVLSLVIRLTLGSGINIKVKTRTD